MCVPDCELAPRVAATQLRARKYRDLGMASAANRCLLEGEEIRECGVRFDQHAQWMKNQRP